MKIVKDRSYVVISPCRNEEKYMRRTLDSVVRQTFPPSLWVIVNDGSTDRTPIILNEYAGKYPFIKVVTRQDRGCRSVGPGVIDAFYAGIDSIDMQRFNFLCKLDLDLELPPRYFEMLIQRMNANPRLGCCSGKPYYIDKATGKLVSEYCGDENSIGASKFYRVACFAQIGGFVRGVMWDGIDGHRCRMLGWIARSWDDPNLRFIHLRPMGSSHKGIFTGRMRHGYGQYFMGTGIIYMTASAIYRMLRRPLLVGGAAMLCGYILSWIGRKEKLDDLEFRKFLRKYQWFCLLKGKKKATVVFERKQAGAWHAEGRSYYRN